MIVKASDIFYVCIKQQTFKKSLFSAMSTADMTAKQQLVEAVEGHQPTPFLSLTQGHVSIIDRSAVTIMAANVVLKKRFRDYFLIIM